MQKPVAFAAEGNGRETTLFTATSPSRQTAIPFGGQWERANSLWAITSRSAAAIASACAVEPALIEIALAATAAASAKSMIAIAASSECRIHPNSPSASTTPLAAWGQSLTPAPVAVPSPDDESNCAAKQAPSSLSAASEWLEAADACTDTDAIAAKSTPEAAKSALMASKNSIESVFPRPKSACNAVDKNARADCRNAGNELPPDSR